MTYLIGISPGTVYTETEAVQGKCPGAGTRGVTSDGKEFLMCKVAATQNIVNGTVVTVNPAFVITVASVAQGLLATQVAVVVASATASTSCLVWCQIYGRGNVLASVSTLPQVPLKIGTTAGVVTDTIVSASAQIDGIVLTATSGVQGAIVAAIITYPKYIPSTLAG